MQVLDILEVVALVTVAHEAVAVLEVVVLLHEAVIILTIDTQVQEVL